MSDWEKGTSGYENDARICSLASSGNERDLDLVEALAKDSQFFCLTCKRSSSDPKKLCSPAFK
ncbi:MAG: hypothetical protein ABSC60_15045 [Acidobacteriota bacterium]